MEDQIRKQCAADRNYTGVDPELPSVDRFIRGTVNSLESQDEDVHAFVRAGLFRSFTARKVLLSLPGQCLKANIWSPTSHHDAFCSSHLQLRCTISPLRGVWLRMVGRSLSGNSLGTHALPSCPPRIAQTSQQDSHNDPECPAAVHAGPDPLSRITHLQHSYLLGWCTRATMTLHTTHHMP